MIARGDIVDYRLSDDDCKRIRAQRDQNAGLYGEAPIIGMVVPAVVLYTEPHVGLQAWPAGNDSLWVPAAAQGGNEGEWSVADATPTG